MKIEKIVFNKKPSNRKYYVGKAATTMIPTLKEAYTFVYIPLRR